MVAARPQSVVAAPEDLLSELLFAFGVDGAPRSAWPAVRAKFKRMAELPPERWTKIGGFSPDAKQVRKALAGLPESWEERPAIYKRELVALAPHLSGWVERIRSIRTGTRPWKTEPEFRKIAEEYNGVLLREKMLSFPPLCDSCLYPVLLRAGQRFGLGRYQLSEVCSDTCHDATKKRLRRASAK